MSETILTKGWKAPSGKCDECGIRPATQWFGDTSVAICTDPGCYNQSKQRWDEMIEQNKRDPNW